MSEDPIRELQRAARAAAKHVADAHANRVVVLDATGRRIMDIAVPAGCAPEPTRAAPVISQVAAGWVVTQQSATFDGKPVAIAMSRLKLLRVLVEATEPMIGKELAKKVFGEHGDEEASRFHIRELRKELQAAFGYEGDPIPNEKSGYWLALR